MRWLCVLMLAGAAALGADKIGRPPELPDSLPWDLRLLSDSPEFRWVEEKKPVRSLIYHGEQMFGEATEIFAFYASPATLGGNVAGEREYPAVVLVHGGGGTAFAEWVWLWASRGYAAIAMDLGGMRPASPVIDADIGELLEDRGFDRKQRTRLSAGGPEQGHPQKFDSIGDDTDDDWPFHAVSAVIRAHSLVRSFREVDPTRTAITGISWGGYTTCIAASIDDRFAAAVPVYGCGFLHEGESVQKPAIDNLELRDEWIRLYDPSSYLGACRVPVLWVNGTNDKHYPLDSYMRSAGLVKGPRTMRIQAPMPHSHRAGWAPAEIGLFIDAYCREGEPLPVVTDAALRDGRPTAKVESATTLKSAALHYTEDAGPLVKRRWSKVAAELKDDGVIGPPLPEEARIWILSVTDERDAMTTSGAMFVVAKSD
jgi:dienelactone hydrolase